MQAIGRHLEVHRRNHLDAPGVHIDAGRRVHGLAEDLKADPAAGISAHGPAVEAEVEKLLDPGRRERRDHGVHEGVFGLMGGGGRFRRVVVASQEQDTAMGRGAGQVAVAQNVAAAVDARTLGVPHGKNAVVAAIVEDGVLLAAPNRRRRQIFVDARLEMDVVAL